MGVGLLKDFSLMGTVPLSAPNPPQQASTINTILNLSQQSPHSYDPRVVPSPSKSSSSPPVFLDPIPLPSSSYDTHLVTSTHKIWRTKTKGGGLRKRKPQKRSNL